MPADLAIDARITVGTFALDVQLELSRGPLLVVGPNGSGKTTLLRALAGGDVLVDGRIESAGRVLVDAARSVWLPPELRSVGYLPQHHALFPHLSVIDNVAFGILTGTADERRTHATRWLDELDIAGLAARMPKTLSGGERQRVAIARALARGPSLLLLDEPTAALDVSARRAVRDRVGSAVASEGRMAVVVTHDVRDLSAWAGSVVVLGEGRARQSRTLAELLEAGEGPFLDELLSPLRG